MRTSDRPLASVGSLVLCCFFWGVAFSLMQFAAAGLASAAGWQDRTVAQDLALRATYTGWRFSAAAALYGLLSFRLQRGYRRTEVVGGGVVGGFFTAGIVLQMAGLRYALPSVSAVLTSTVVVFTPLAQYFLLGRPVSARIWQAVAIALSGVLILSLPNPAAAASSTLAVTPPLPWLGEGATVLASLFFTGQVLALDHYGKEADPARFTFVMFAVTGALAMSAGLLLGAAPLYEAPVLARLAGDARFLRATATMVTLSSVVAFHLMNTAQPKVTPAAASVIYCTEPVFATLWSVVLGTESITWVTLLGGGVVLAAMLRLAPTSAPIGERKITAPPH